MIDMGDDIELTLVYLSVSLQKIEAGAELLKRDTTSCKSAQLLLDELFGVDSKGGGGGAGGGVAGGLASLTVKQKLPNLALSSPNSCHSSANNTPLLNIDASTDPCDNGGVLDPDMTNINELVASGILELIESYSFEDDPQAVAAAVVAAACRKTASSKEVRPLIDDVELYKQLGV